MKLVLKIYATDESVVENHEFISVMQAWIRHKSLPGVLIDVVDYGHVKGGPGILIACHDENYSTDRADDRLGILYQRKTASNGTNVDKILSAVEVTRQAAGLLESALPIKFRHDRIDFWINDRLFAPNVDETFKRLQSDFENAGDKIFKGQKFSVERIMSDPRDRFGVRLHIQS